MSTWVFGDDKTALEFTPAEVSMLFPAPLTRRQLFGYKLYRSQVIVLVNSLIWVFVLRRGGTALPSPLRAISLWVMFSTMNLHRLGAALVWSSWREHGRAGVKRNLWSIVFFAAVGVALVAGFIVNRAVFSTAHDVGEFFYALGRVLSTAPASIGLWPFHLIVGPIFARSVGEWARAILPAIGVLLVHVGWIVRTDTAFEDAAVAASAERARRLDAFRARRSASMTPTKTSVKSTMPLASTGNPAYAILWKNLLCLRRTWQPRVFIAPLVMSIAIGAAISRAGADVPEMIAATAIVLAALLVVFGSRLIRNDLRHDMLHLPLLKTLPLAPSQIVLAEVASAALPMAALQFALVAAAYVASLASSEAKLEPALAFGLLLASPFAILALNGALHTIQNATAVLFPAWIRLGTTVSTGVEALGQNLLIMIANLVTLAMGLVLPALVSWLTFHWFGAPRAALIIGIVIVAAMLLMLETYGIMRFLGRALARAEPIV